MLLCVKNKTFSSGCPRSFSVVVSTVVVNLPLLLVLPKGSKRKKPTWQEALVTIRVVSLSVNSLQK